MTVVQFKLTAVRRWHKKLLDNGVSPVTSAKAYRLLRAIMNTVSRQHGAAMFPARG